jgi:ABC-type dipeptide/oligopeptide/nickel transport system ATPase component
LLQELKSEFGLTYIFIPHSLPVVAQVAARIAVMCAGKSIEVGSAEQVFHDPNDDYTRELIAALPALPTPSTLHWASTLNNYPKLTISSRLG